MAKTKIPSGKIKFLDCVFLTQEEHDKLIILYGKTAIDRLVKDLDYAIDCKKAKYVNHYKVIQVWAGRNKLPIIKPKPFIAKEPPKPIILATPEQIAEIKASIGGDVFKRVPYIGKPSGVKIKREIARMKE